MSATALALLATTLGGCVYRMNIQQGNYLEGKTVDQLQSGMTRSQVRYLLGTPMVPAVFDKDRWDYVYYFKRGRLRRPEERHLIVFFRDDKVTRFERDNVPNSAPQAPDQGPPVSKFPGILEAPPRTSPQRPRRWRATRWRRCSRGSPRSPRYSSIRSPSAHGSARARRSPKMPTAALSQGMSSDGPAAARAAMSASRMLASGLSSTLQRYCRSRVA